jgi:hypothetical protein
MIILSISLGPIIFDLLCIFRYCNGMYNYIYRSYPFDELILYHYVMIYLSSVTGFDVIFFVCCKNSHLSSHLGAICITFLPHHFQPTHVKAKINSW